MNTQTSLVAEQIRLQQWADQIRDCQNRPSDMKVDAWCREHGITKANYGQVTINWTDFLRSYNL